MSGPVVADRRRDPWTIFRLAAAWSVLGLWIASAVINAIPSLHKVIVTRDYTPLLTLIVGALFAPDFLGAWSRRRNGKDEPDAG